MSLPPLPNGSSLLDVRTRINALSLASPADLTADGDYVLRIVNGLVTYVLLDQVVEVAGGVLDMETEGGSLYLAIGVI